ncbi:unnamed protein product, partial [marine sediment metagenome]
VPVMVALWPLFVWGIYLPDTERSLKREQGEYSKAQNIMLEILALDPGRLEFTDANSAPAEFAYISAVDKVASYCGIPSANYKLSTGPIITRGGKKSQTATVGLKDVSITKFAKFLSTIQLRWADLQCVQLRKLKKKAGFPDRWDVDLEFKYYY